jgi:hypothetical protein
MKAWHITDWEKYYEVNSDGGRRQPGQKKRAKPPEYIRWYVGGPGRDDRAYQECGLAVEEKFGPEAWAVAFALFGKLLEVAASQDTECRGYILGKNHSPISTKLLTFVTLFTGEQVELGLRVLSDAAVGWLEEQELPDLSASLAESPGGSPSLAETPGNSPSLQEAKAKAKSKGKEEEAKGESEPEAQPPGQEAGPAGSPASFSSSPSSLSLRSPGAPRTPQPQPFSGARFASSVHLALKLGNGAPKQHQADLRDFEKAANHILAGHLGTDAKTVGESCLTRAWEIGRDGKVQNKAAYWLTWFKAHLEEKGYEWDA